MTDDEANDFLHRLCLGQPEHKETWRHALRAIADRAALVDACEATAAMDCPSCVDAARRHMEGK